MDKSEEARMGEQEKMPLLKKIGAFRESRAVTNGVLALIAVQMILLFGQLLCDEETLPGILQGCCNACYLLGILLSALTWKMKRPLEIYILLVYALWLNITRFILGCYEESLSTTVYVVAITFIFISAGSILNHDQRRLLLRAVTVLYCTVGIAFAILAVVLQWTGREEISVADIALVSLFRDDVITNIDFLYAHRNITSNWWMIGFFLVLYHGLKLENKKWWFFLAPVAVLMLYAISVQKSRTVMICTAFWGAFVLASVFVRLLRRKCRSNAVKIGISVVLAVVIFAGAVLLIQNGSTLLSHKDGFAVEDRRDFSADAGTLNSRTLIWKGLIGAIKENPRILLFGMREKSMPEALVVPEEASWLNGVTHMHNMFMQTLGLTGAAGLALLVVFLLSLGGKVLWCLKKPADTEEAFAVKALVALMGALLLDGMMEPMLFATSSISMAHLLTVLPLYLVIGVFIAEFAEKRSQEKESATLASHD